MNSCFNLIYRFSKCVVKTIILFGNIFQTVGVTTMKGFAYL